MENTALHYLVNPLETFSSEQQGLFDRVLRAIASGQTELIEQGVTKIVSSATDPGDGYYRIGMALLQHNYPGYAKQYFAKASHLIPNVCDSFLQIGRCAQQLGDLEDAITNYKNVLSINPNHAEALAHLSISYYQKNELDQAQRSIENWIRACPAMASAYNLLGCIYLERQQYRDAISQFNQALQFDITNYDAIVNLGQAHTHLYQYQEADSYFHRALAINPNSSNLQTYCGINALNQRDFTKAREYLTEAIRLDEHNALAYANLSVLLQWRNCFGSSNKAMRRALILSIKKLIFTLNLLITCYYKIILINQLKVVGVHCN